jgi:hypothetical protein
MSHAGKIEHVPVKRSPPLVLIAIVIVYPVFLSAPFAAIFVVPPHGGGQRWLLLAYSCADGGCRTGVRSASS